MIRLSALKGSHWLARPTAEQVQYAVAQHRRIKDPSIKKHGIGNQEGGAGDAVGATDGCSEVR